MTPEEQEEFQLSTLKMTEEEAVSEYQKCASKPWGVLLAKSRTTGLRVGRKSG